MTHCRPRQGPYAGNDGADASADTGWVMVSSTVTNAEPADDTAATRC